MQIKVLFENNDVMVINKPAGITVHRGTTTTTTAPTVVDWILEQYPEIRKVGEDVSRPGIVHRIDRDTSGCLIIAKTQDAFVLLKDQFKKHQVKKKYIALVQGWFRDKRGIIDTPLGRSSGDIRAWTTKTQRATVRSAVTRYVVQREFIQHNEKISLVELYPETGRTHQLRVHMTSLQHPILGDTLYGKSSPLIHRTALHAYQVTFKNSNHEEIMVQAPIPEDIASLLNV